MSELQIKIDYETHEIEWDDVTIPMKQRGTLSDPERTHDIYKFTKELSVLKMSEDRHNEIIKAMYGKIDIKEHVNRYSVCKTKTIGTPFP